MGRVSGGGGVSRYVRARKDGLRKQPAVIEVGYKGHIASLAYAHEYGQNNPDGSTRLPERPAFRAALSFMERAAGAEARRIATSRTPFMGFTHADAVKIGRAALHELRESYFNFQGTPLSEAQAARKAGTPYADRLLIGREGPKMIEHLSVWVDGQQVA